MEQLQTNSYNQMPESQPQETKKPTLPNALPGMILGISSLAMACSPLAGLILAIIGLSLSKSAAETDLQNPGLYSGQQFAKTGKITSTIGLVIGILSLIFWIIYFVLVYIGVTERYDMF